MIHRLCGIGGLVAVSALATLTSGSALAAPALPAPENSLLGVRLMSRFGEVLKKFGQPNEIQVGAPVIPSQGNNAASAGAGSGGGMMGGGMPGGMMGGRMGGGMPGMPPGMMQGGYPGMGGMGQGGGMMGGRMGQGGFPGMGGMAQGGGRGLPGFPGGQGGAGGEDGGMAGFKGGSNFPGAGGNAGALGSGMTSGGGDAVNTETTWWYHFPQQGVHIGFLFNKDGHVIQIQEYGWNPAKGIPSATRQGITLGSPLGQIIRRYGWSSDGETTGDNVTLRYGDKHRVGFQLVRNKVAGITLAVGE